MRACSLPHGTGTTFCEVRIEVRTRGHVRVDPNGTCGSVWIVWVSISTKTPPKKNGCPKERRVSIGPSHTSDGTPKSPSRLCPALKGNSSCRSPIECSSTPKRSQLLPKKGGLQLGGLVVFRGGSHSPSAGLFPGQSNEEASTCKGHARKPEDASILEVANRPGLSK